MAAKRAVLPASVTFAGWGDGEKIRKLGTSDDLGNPQRDGKIGKFGFARTSGMSYVSTRIGITLIPDNSKPTATWGRKAMGLVAFSSVWQ